MSNSSSNSSGGIGFCGLLFIVFLILKLGVGDTVVKTWSWWWVCAPLWGAGCSHFGYSVYRWYYMDYRKEF